MSEKKLTKEKGKARRTPRKTSSSRQRRPHNAKRDKGWSTLDELVALVGREARQVTRNGELVTMSRAERRLRDEVDKGLKGEVRALKLLLGLMIKHPSVVKEPVRTTTIIFGPLARV